MESQEGKEGTCQLWKRTENKVMLTKIKNIRFCQYTLGGKGENLSSGTGEMAEQVKVLTSTPDDLNPHGGELPHLHHQSSWARAHINAR